MIGVSSPDEGGPPKRLSRETVPTRLKPLLPRLSEEPPVQLPRVLEEEFVALHGRLPEGYPDEKAPAPVRLAALFDAVHALDQQEKPRTALCLSGGGIRSATFALGIVQGLARHRLFSLFDYLSTVSGGGYLGSWLSAWIAREDGDVAKIEALMAGDQAAALVAEPPAVDHLRAYSNYLTPRFGLLSTDTWVLLTTVLRNLLLNWLLLVPVIGAAMMFPRLWMMSLSLSPPSGVASVFLGIAILLAILGLSYVPLDMPSVGNRRGSQSRFLVLCLVPVVVAVFLLTTLWAWESQSFSAEHRLPLFIASGVAVHLLAAAVCWIQFRKLIRPTFLLVAAITGAFGGLAAWWLVAKIFTRLTDVTLPWYVVIAPGVSLLLLAILGTLFVGLTSRVTQDEDREWWARAGAWILIVIVTWSAFSAISVMAPNLPDTLAALISSAGGLAGILTAILGYSSKIPSAKGDAKGATRDALFNAALALAAPVFTVALLVVESIGTAWLLGELTGGFDTSSASARGRALMIGLGLFLGLIALALLMSGFIDANRFSLHSLYRNRLVRAYLGAARTPESRNDASPFTGFAKSDDLDMADLSDSRPFHMLNLTLNLVDRNRLAWQERKAESFTVSRLHCGSNRIAYRPSAHYAGRITLGTAATISGAAASPNMGYHSSPALTFLMTFFNARLGCWLGNPGEVGWLTWFQTGPRFALRPILAEAFGRTNDNNPYVYLSDGGHFENLGLYEMVLRRCHLIVVSDAGCDSKFTFGDLGNAVRKIRIDLGIPIEFRGRTLSQTLSTDEGKYGAVADILYNCVDHNAEDGLLVYIKPSINGTEPADIRNYKARFPDFPHETTADQWFSESQFESYRMLGSHIIDEICGTVRGSLFAFGKQAEAYLGPPEPTKLGGRQQPG